MSSADADRRPPSEIPPPSPLVQGAFHALQTAWPGGAGRLAAWLFCRPPRPRLRPAERALLRGGRPFTLAARGFRLRGWTWGQGPAVLLHHGWGGRAAHMGAFVGPLVAAGRTVVAYDAPAHGASSGRITCGPEMSWVLEEAAGRLGGIDAVVGHSVGAAATLMALGRGLSLGRAALLASPAEFRSFIRIFGDHIGLEEAGRRAMADRAARWYGLRWSEMDVEHWSNGAALPLLLIHDADDAVVPLGDAHRIARAWPGCRLVTTEGLGHRRLRTDPGVVARVVDFLAVC